MKGIVFRGKVEKFKLHHLKLVQSDSFAIPFDKTLFVEGVTIPVDLLPAGWNFLERWDLAVPLWRYGQTAADIGTVGEREETRLIIRDLRVLLHSYELLFVRKNEAGQAFMECWERECSSGGDKRLAFLRTLYQVKPRLCVLPTSWLAKTLGEPQRQKLTRQFPAGRSKNSGSRLVTIELEPGRLVKVHQGDEEKVLEHFRRLKEGSKRGRN